MATPKPSLETPPWESGTLRNRSVTIPDIRRAFTSVDGGSQRDYGLHPSSVKPAAAVLPIVESDGEAAVLVTKRPVTMQFHKGDWVFPGGRVDGGDASPWDTAVREVHEELGVPPESVDILGHLHTYGPFVTGFLLHVYVGILSSRDEIVPHPREVADVRILPISGLTAPGAYFTGVHPGGHDAGPTVRPAATPRARAGLLRFFSVGPEEYLWGTQGEILWDLLTIVYKTASDHETDTRI